jgi:hypothetical protein
VIVDDPTATWSTAADDRLASVSEDPREPPSDERGADEDSTPGAVGEARSMARAALEAGQAVVRPVGGTISAARAVIDRAGHALQPSRSNRVRRLRRLAKTPLPLLYDVHPDAHRALPHPLGVRTIPVAEIAGSAVEPTQRGGDFLPLRDLRTGDWAARWQRLGWANERLAYLPPIDVVRYGDRYWVLDGHNRVALALYEDQPEIDANVVDLHLRGEPIQRAGALAPLLEEARAAGPTRFQRRAVDEAEPEAQREPPDADPPAGTPER